MISMTKREFVLLVTKEMQDNPHYLRVHLIEELSSFANLSIQQCIVLTANMDREQIIKLTDSTHAVLGKRSLTLLVDKRIRPIPDRDLIPRIINKKSKARFKNDDWSDFEIYGIINDETKIDNNYAKLVISSNKATIDWLKQRFMSHNPYESNPSRVKMTFDTLGLWANRLH